MGAHGLRVLSPSILELWIVLAKPPGDPFDQWDFVAPGGGAGEPSLKLPDPAALRVSVGGAPAAVKAIGLKRRAIYAPQKRRDLRVLASLYIELASPIPEGATALVTSQDVSIIKPGQRFEARADKARTSPAIHVNQVGYLPGAPKRAIVGAYLGSLGELAVPQPSGFHLIDAKTGREAFAGRLVPRKEAGSPPPDASYQNVFEADFSAFEEPGEYRVSVPGLGASLPFRIDEGTAAAVARTYALGLYHQRCGVEVGLPFTRYSHGPCHTAEAFVPAPTREFARVEERLARMTADFNKNTRHTAPPLRDLRSGLYPIVRTGRIDVSGGHHDAGDYSKYTTNSAALVHTLVFAADSLGGAGDLDNLGLPESGDGVGDLLQIAKWEADFLIKMQDDDGGFYFLVHPKERPYEDDTLPDRGDLQVVFPKTTASTAAAVAALAQASSSPRMKAAYPADAARYAKSALRGYRFLKAAIDARGPDGSYQKITHYGDVFMHDDELAWARTEIFLLTGDEAVHKDLLRSFDPSDPRTRRWGWERLFEGYGAAVRSYAFAARSGRVRASALDPAHLAKSEAEIREAAAELDRYAAASAYATSFPLASKRHRAAGWYFPVSAAFDLAVSDALSAPDSRPEPLTSLSSNIDFELGANPNNVVFLTGLGWRRQREVVHQYAMNDRRILPPPGIPIGSAQAGPPYLELYKRELGELSFPPDGAAEGAFPLYDRWGDLFNVKTEFVAVAQARALASLCMLMAKTKLRGQPYRGIAASIDVAPGAGAAGEVVATLAAPGHDLAGARIVWEGAGLDPTFGSAVLRRAAAPGPSWIEAEAVWPDGRRAFAVWEQGGAVAAPSW